MPTSQWANITLGHLVKVWVVEGLLASHHLHDSIFIQAAFKGHHTARVTPRGRRVVLNLKTFDNLMGEKLSLFCVGAASRLYPALSN